MKSTFFILLIILSVSFQAKAQLPSIKEYKELQDPLPRDLGSWDGIDPGSYSGFVSSNQHFNLSSAPKLYDVHKEWKKKAWRGEKVHTQGLIYTTKALQNISLNVSDLVSSSNQKISKSHINANFVRYVMADHLGDLKSGCAIKIQLDTSLRADMIDNLQEFSMEDSTSRPIWLSVEVPRNVQSGTYSGFLTIQSEDYTEKHPFSIEVSDRTLPEVKDWVFHLDLWQNPYSDARVNGVDLWSEEHFEVMKEGYKMLAAAGQKVITTTLIHDPWSAQTYDVYGGMVKWVKKKDGSWQYDYSVFDKWVEFMMDLGIDRQINAYSMIPWTLAFRYYDEGSQKEEVLEAKPDSEEYAAHWGRMLKDFAAHLKEKGWFEKTTIAMDERPEEDMKSAIAIIKASDPLFLISMAGNYHEELQASLVYYSVASNQNISPETLAFRKSKGYTTTFYTACPEPFPNVFTSSDYAELTWLSWHALHKDYDGFLRWDFNNWNSDPFKDSRFGAFPSGDTYFVYPGARSSIRFEKLREGIQDFEKATLLKRELKTKGDIEGLKRLEAVIQNFRLDSLDGTNAHDSVEKAQSVIDSF